MLQLDGFEGPLDLLLELARAQKIDLARISILQLVEQYLAAVEAARSLRLELAADWLVMAAWLTWLKSKLLLPQDQDAGGSDDAEAAAAQLAARLEALAHIGRAAAWLGARDQLGRDVFARGTPEQLVQIDRSGLKLELPHLLGGYMAAARRTARKRRYRPRPLALWTMGDALARLRMLLGQQDEGGLPPGWHALEMFLPDDLATWSGHPHAAQRLRAALAGALLASLELARLGELEIRQAAPFGEILLHPADRASLREAAE